MWSSRAAFENDVCPVGDDLLGAMYRANENGLPLLVENVSAEARAMLALFCYRRSHLHALGVAIAGTCTELELVNAGGRVGMTLYALSREASPAAVPAASHNRRKITLSTRPLSTIVPLDDEIDADDDAANDAPLAPV